MEQFFGLVLLGLIIWFIYAWKTRNKPRKSSVRQSGGSKGTSKANSTAEGLAFDIAGKEPECDDQGRVIARLGSGSQIELDVFELNGEDHNLYLLGKPKDDFVERSVRVRVAKALKRDKELYEVSTTKGEVFGEITYRDTELANSVFTILEQKLQQSHPALADKSFVFDVSMRVEGEWYEDEDEESGWVGSVDNMTLRIKDPASIDIQ